MRTRRRHTKLLPEGLQLVKVRLVLLLVLHLLLDALEDADGGSVVVHATGCTDGGLDDRGCGNKVVGEAVVETALDLEQVLGRLEEVDVALREGLERLLAVRAGGGAGERGGDAGRGGAGTEERRRELGTQHGCGKERESADAARRDGEDVVVAKKRRAEGARPGAAQPRLPPSLEPVQSDSRLPPLRCLDLAERGGSSTVRIHSLDAMEYISLGVHRPCALLARVNLEGRGERGAGRVWLCLGRWERA